ncbi:LAS superfamily LD-carboxypeptidase LdcB [Bacillus thuringiensis]|nr:D-alanyl-D-alanine carboxypeptidase [Bacillus cereus]SEJ94829.1 D-alanyl-D-alanine carboxypeptidase [Bacillus thuringiensis]
MGADYALPAGYSEHSSGLSLDIGSGLTQMD